MVNCAYAVQREPLDTMLLAAETFAPSKASIATAAFMPLSEPLVKDAESLISISVVLETGISIGPVVA